MNAFKLCQGSFRRQIRLGHLQSGAHDEVQDQCHETDHRMSPNALRQSVIHRRYLNLGFQDFEATLDISQALVSLHNLFGFQVRDVGHQQ